MSRAILAFVLAVACFAVGYWRAASLPVSCPQLAVSVVGEADPYVYRLNCHGRTVYLAH